MTLPSSISPRHHQIFLILLQRIKEGIYPFGFKLPGELELAKEFEVARATIRVALQKLVDEGFIERRQGIGSFPRKQKNNKRYTQGRTDVFVGDIKLESQILDYSWIVPSDRISHELALTNGEKVMRIKRLIFNKTKPFFLTDVYIPSHIASKIELEKIRNKPIFYHLEELGYSATYADQSLFARIADAPISNLLNMPEGGALLAYHNVVMDNQKITLVVQESFLDSSKYEYLISPDLEIVNDVPHWRTR